MNSYVHDVEGEPQETVEFTVRMGRAGFELLQRESLRVSEIWLTKQPDGSFALGVVTPRHPSELGYQAQAVANDDRRERFPGAGASRLPENHEPPHGAPQFIDMRHLLD